MSLESSISGLIATLKSMSVGYASSASELARAADDQLRGLKPPDVGDVEYEVFRDNPDYTRITRPPKLTGLTDLALPTPGNLQAIDQIEDKFTGKAPKLVIPEFKYSDLGNSPTFTDKSPRVSALTVKPKLPTLVRPDAPNLTVPRDVSVDPITGAPPDVPLPVFTEFEGDFYDEYQRGLAEIAPDIVDVLSFFSRLRTDLAPIEQALIARVTAILHGTEPGLPDDWESESYDQARQELNSATLQDQEALDQQPSAQTGLPTGAMTYARLKTLFKNFQVTTQAAAKITGERQKQEVQHVQAALELCSKMIDAAIDLRAQSVGWRMKGLILALDGAQGALDLALKLLEFKKRELAMLVHYNETQLRRTDDRVKIEMTKLEALKIAVANSKLKAAYNDNNINIYRIAEGFIETKVKLFQAQIDYLVVDIGWRKLAMQAYEADIAAYQANVKAVQSEQAELAAKIKGDLALADAELAKARLYEADLAAQSAKAKALAAKAQAQAADNQNKLALYNETVDAKLSKLKAHDRYIQHAVAAIVKGFAAEVAEQELTLKSQEQKDRQALNDAMVEMQYEQVDLLNKFKLYAIQMERATSTGMVMEQGASTLGSIATQAFGGLNTVGSKAIVESA